MDPWYVALPLLGVIVGHLLAMEYPRWQRRREARRLRRELSRQLEGSTVWHVLGPCPHGHSPYDCPDCRH